MSLNQSFTFQKLFNWHYSRFMNNLFLGFFLFFLTFLVTKSLWQISWYPMHDSTHIARAYLMDKTIQSGQIPPLWADSANEDYGYPLFHFYAPLVYYLVVFLKHFLPSYILSLKLTLTLFTFFGGLGMYFLSRQWGRLVAYLNSASFLLLIYGALNLYVRGAFAEYASMMLLPWLFFVWRRRQTRSTSLVTAFVTTLFLLTHNLTPLIVFPVLSFWIIYYHHSHLKSLFYPSLLTFLLSAFFLFPLFLERHFVQVDTIAKTTNFRLHFLQPWQIWNSTWGFGGSAPGVQDGMSFKIGKLQILLSLFGLLYLFKVPQLRPFGFLLASFVVFAFLMTTSFSLPIWQLTSYLAMIQFPWRYLTLLGFLLSFLSGFTLKLFPKLIRLPILTLFLFLCLFFNLKYFKPQYDNHFTDAHYLNHSYISHTLAHIIPEYLPSWLPTFPSQPSSSLIQPDFLLLSSQATYNHYRFNLKLSHPQTIIIAKAYYPTWQAKLDGRPLSLTPTSHGFIQTSLPAGQHTLILYQSHTLLERITFLISLLTLLYIIKQAFYYLTK